MAGTAYSQQLQLRPRSIELRGPESSIQVIVDASSADRGSYDLTSTSQFRVEDRSVAVVSERGIVEPRGEGKTQLIVSIGKEQLTAEVSVTQFDAPAPVSFEHDVNPVLTKAGCNSGGCHGKAEGKNGFRLSLFGFDVEADYQALTQQGRGRRINLLSPPHSLILQKATAQVPHGGGMALSPESFGYRRVLRWIGEGAPLLSDDELAIQRIEVQPAERTLQLLRPGQNQHQQLRVIATDHSGRRLDVTTHCAFESSAPQVAEVDEGGRVSTLGVPGEAAILVRYMGSVAVSRIGVPRQGIASSRPPENNFIDSLTWDKHQQMGIVASDLCDDATFLRRASLDLIGTLPDSSRVTEFLQSTDPYKREKLVDWLLEQPEYATFWAMRWADVMRIDANALGPSRAIAATRWLREQFAENRPFDQIARDILLARGDMESIAPAAIYTTLKNPTEAASSMSQLMLGVRIGCAECHHHPFERWSQSDFYAFAGFFTGMQQKTSPAGSTMLVPGAGRDLRHPRTGEAVPAAGLGQTVEPKERPTSLLGTGDRRAALADWMTDAKNPFFAKAFVNRMWANFFGRGLVEPVDDMRATNPATIQPVLDTLAGHFQKNRYNIKDLIRTILASRVYQLSSETNESNRSDTQYFSHAKSRAVPAEVLLDAICHVTGIPEKFNGWPIGARAIEVWDNRMPSYFFRIFGRPQRTSVCSCERGGAPSISQALHLMNSPDLGTKIADRDGVAKQLAESNRTPDQIIDQLYLRALSRLPTSQQRELLHRQLGAKLLPGPERREAVEDLMWALLNSKEFIYNH